MMYDSGLEGISTHKFLDSKMHDSLYVFLSQGSCSLLQTPTIGKGSDNEKELKRLERTLGHSDGRNRK